MVGTSQVGGLFLGLVYTHFEHYNDCHQPEVA